MGCLALCFSIMLEVRENEWVFSENVLESNFLVKGVRPAQSPIIKMSACRCVSGFKSFLDVGVKGKKTTNLI